MNEIVASRRGGRKSRQAVRSAPLPDDKKPVRKGLEGGAYRPLSDKDVERINEASLKILEEIGLADALPSCIELITNAGGTLTDEGRLLIPRDLVQHTLKIAARHFTLHGREDKHNLEPWGKKVHFGTGGAAVHIVDSEKNEYRESTVTDLYDIARMVDTLDNVHYLQRPIVCRDIPDPREMDLNTLYACLSGTSKHVGTSFTEGAFVEDALKMLHIVAGSEEAWRAKPFVSMSNCFVVPPMKFAEDASHCLEAGVKGGMPILLLAAGQAGATSPAAIAGAVVQEVAEVLAGLVYINLLKPGHPAIFGTWPFVSDLRTGAMSGGSGEQAILSAACAQMGQYYDLPVGVPAGMTDSKVPDAQSGYEKGYTEVLLAQAGCNMIYECAGMHASLLGFSFEGAILDNDLIGSVLRTVRGVEVTEDSLSIETIREVCTQGPGHYLGHSQTMDRMEIDYIYPVIGDRTSPKEWVEQGSTNSVQRARTKKLEILSSYYPDHISEEIDARIREEFPIKLPRTSMRPSDREF